LKSYGHEVGIEARLALSEQKWKRASSGLCTV